VPAKKDSLLTGGKKRAQSAQPAKNQAAGQSILKKGADAQANDSK
jgi:hypothetical protein